MISAVKVVDGYADGSFNPQGQLTRGAAAKIICNLILTPTTAAELPTNVAPYKDVPVNHTFAGYIAYCQEKGIISGYADGTFKPAAPLTSYAFMKMLLGALGYSSDAEGYTGTNWAINVAKQALGIGLDDGLKDEFVGTKNVTREEAALYAFNTLKATMVEYPEKTTVTMGDATVTLAGKAQDVEWGTGKLNDGKVAKDGFVQFGEKYFAKLTREDDIDVFGRPANKWTYDKKDIGSYVDYTKLVAEYTTGVEGGDVYADVTSVAADYDLFYYVDGEKLDKAATNKEFAKIAKKNDDTMLSTGNGALTQIYVDNDAEELTIAVINTYLAETDDYNEKKETLKLDLYGYGDVKALELEDFASIADYEDGDLVLVTVADGEVQSIVDPETVKGTEIEEFSKKDYVVADEKYAYALTGAQEYSMGADLLKNYDKSNLDGVTFDLYFDTYGYLIGIKQVEDDTEYVFITGMEQEHSALANKYADAFAIFADGTTANIKVDLRKSFEDAEPMRELSYSDEVVNTWFTYTVKNDVYTLEYAENQLHMINLDIEDAEPKFSISKIDSKHISQYDEDAEMFYYGNADTNYIVAKVDNINDLVAITGVDSVTTGVKNVSLNVWNEKEVLNAIDIDDDESELYEEDSQGVYSIYEGGYIVASIVLGDDGAISNRFAYMYGEPKYEKYNKANDVYTWEQAVIMNGEDTTVTFKSELPADDSFKEGLYKLSYDKEGFVVDAVKAKKGTDYVGFMGFDPEDTKIVKVEAEVNLTAEGDTLWITEQSAKRGFVLADECPAVIVEKYSHTKNDVKEVVEYTSVAKAIRGLENYGMEDGNFSGTLIIFFEDGIATSVVMTDVVSVKDNTNPNTPNINTEVEVKVENGVITVTDKGEDEATTDEIANAIVAKLNAQGYKDVKVTVKDGKVKAASATKGSIEYAFDVKLPVKLG